MAGIGQLSEANRSHQVMGPTSETYRYIVRSAGVRSGDALIEGTRIGVHEVIACFRTAKRLRR